MPIILISNHVIAPSNIFNQLMIGRLIPTSIPTTLCVFTEFVFRVAFHESHLDWIKLFINNLRTDSSTVEPVLGETKSMSFPLHIKETLLITFYVFFQLVQKSPMMKFWIVLVAVLPLFEASLAEIWPERKGRGDLNSLVFWQPFCKCLFVVLDGFD